MDSKHIVMSDAKSTAAKENENDVKQNGVTTRGRRRWIAFEVFAALCLLLVVLAGLLVWRLSAQPLPISFAKDYIEDALNSDDQTYRVSLSDARLHWPDLKGPLYLGLESVALNASDGRNILSVQEMALALSKRQLLVGKLAPELAVLRSSRFHVVRSADGSLDFGMNDLGEEEVSVEDSNPVEESSFSIDEFRAQLAVALDQLSTNKDLTPILSQFQGVQVENASVVLEDFSTNSSWFFPDFDATFVAQGSSLELRGGLSLQSFEEGSDSDLRVRIAAFYDAEKKSLNAKLSSENVSKAIFGLLPIKANYDADFTSNISLEIQSDDFLKNLTATLHVTSKGGVLSLPDYYDEALTIKDIDVSFIYDDSATAFRIQDSRLMLDDIPVLLSGEFIINETSLEKVPEVKIVDAAEGGDVATIDTVLPEPSKIVSGHFGFEIPTVEQSRLDAFWPEPFKEENAYTWMVERLSNGTFRDVKGEVHLSAVRSFGEEGGASTSLGFDNFTGTFNYTGLTIDYRSPMIPITSASGSGRIDYAAQTLNIGLSKGTLKTKGGTLALSKADLELTNILITGGSKAVLNIAMNGPMAGAFDFISKEPLAVEHRFQSSLDDLKGEAAINVGLNFPASSDLRVKDINVDVSADITNARLPAIVSGLDLTGGPFKLSVNNERVQVSGSGQFDGRPIDVTWMQYLDSDGRAYSSKVEAKLEADPNLRQKMGIDLSTFLEGTAGVNVTYFERSDVLADFDIEMDLNKARVFMEPLAYEKPVGVRGFARAKGFLKKDKLQSLKEISVSTQNLQLDKGELYFDGDNDLRRGSVPRFQVDATDAALDFTIEPETELTTINIAGPVFDLSAFVGGKEQSVSQVAVDGIVDEGDTYDSAPLKIAITADVMTAGGKEDLRAGKIFADIASDGRFNALTFDAQAGGGGVMMRYAPNAQGAQTFSLEAEDAGAALRAFDMFDDIRGGYLSIYAVPVGYLLDRNLKGKAQIVDFRVVNTPVVARLLGSLNNASEIANTARDSGLSFKKLEADFDWVYRDQGSTLVLKDGRTSGNSLGLTFKGDYHSGANKMDVSGTIVPLSGLNKALSNIPVIGQVLSGGTGSVFAATYTIKGDADDPKVAVNPLSVLAPGLIRRILFEN